MEHDGILRIHTPGGSRTHKMQILSLLRLPFRHGSKSNQFKKWFILQARFELARNCF